MRGQYITILLLSVITTTCQYHVREPDPSRTVKITLDNITYVGREGVVSNGQTPMHTKQVNYYYGIRYALPPKRFSPAEPLPPSPTSIEADAFSRPPACIQAKPSSPNVAESEDCLTINFFVPAFNQSSVSTGIQRDGLPIMIFLHGGGFQNGESSLDMYDASNLAAFQDVIVAVPNYRLNVFGFPGFTANGSGDESLNLGLHDQREAMRFVRKHARAFRGDPEKITLFGQSAGARSADFHVLTMGFKHKEELPFRAVIMQSGSAELVPLADWRKARIGNASGNGSLHPPFLRLAGLVGCSSGSNGDVFDCMRRVPAELLKNAIIEHKLYFPTVQDSQQTTVQDEKFVREGSRFNNVPILMGTNANEASTVIHKEADESELVMERYIEDVLGFALVGKQDKAIIIKQLKEIFGGPFPSTRFNNIVDAITAMETELAYTCMTSREALASTKGGDPVRWKPQPPQPGAPTWRYFFNASFPSTEQFAGAGAYHGIEIRFILGKLKGKVGIEELNLRQFMQELWGKFAKDPNHALPWPKLGSSENDLGIINNDGRMLATKSSAVDKNCNIYEPFYSGRA